MRREPVFFEARRRLAELPEAYPLSRDIGAASEVSMFFLGRQRQEAQEFGARFGCTAHWRPAWFPMVPMPKSKSKTTKRHAPH